MTEDQSLHLAVVLRRAGVSYTAAMFVIATTCALQYVFLSRLWLGYIYQYSGELIPSSIALGGILTTALGLIAIAVISIRRWRRGDTAARNLERPATHISFDSVHEVLRDVSARSTLKSNPTLLYDGRFIAQG